MSGVLRNFALSYCLVITTVFAGFPQSSRALDDTFTLPPAAPAAKEVTQVSEIDVWGITQWDHVSSDGSRRRGLHEELQGYFRQAGPQSNASFKTELSFQVNPETGHLQVVNVNHQKDPGCYDEFKVKAALVIDHGGYLYIVPHDNPSFVAIERPNFEQAAVAGYWRIRKADFMTTFENDPPLALWHYFSADEGISPVSVAEIVSPRRNKLSALREQYAPKTGVIEISDDPTSEGIRFEDLWSKVYATPASDLEIALEETGSTMRYLVLGLMVIGAVDNGGLSVVAQRLGKIQELLDKIESRSESLSPQLQAEIQLIRQHLFGLFSGEDPKLKEVFNASFQNYLVDHKGTPVRDRGSLDQSYMNQLRSVEDALGVVAGELDSKPARRTAIYPAKPQVLTLSMRDLIYNKNSTINTRKVALSLKTKVIGWIAVLGALTTGIVFAVSQTMSAYRNYDAIYTNTLNWKAALGFTALMVFLVAFHQVLKVVCMSVTQNKNAKAAFIQVFSRVFNALNNVWHTLIRYRLFFGLSPKYVDQLSKGIVTRLPEGEQLSALIVELLAKKKAATTKQRFVTKHWTSENQELLDRAIEARDTAFNHAVASKRLTAETIKMLRIWLKQQGVTVDPQDMVGLMGALMTNGDIRAKLSVQDIQLAIQAAELMAAYDLEDFDGDLRRQGLQPLATSARAVGRFDRAWKLATQMKQSLDPRILAKLGVGEATSYLVSKPITRGTQEPNNQMYRMVFWAVAPDMVFSFIPEIVARAAIAPPDTSAFFNPALGIAPDIITEVLFQLYFMFVMKVGYLSDIYNPRVSARPPDYKNPDVPYRDRLGLVFQNHLFSWDNHWRRAIHIYIAMFWFRMIFRVGFSFLSSGFTYLYGTLGFIPADSFKGFEFPNLDYMVWYLFLCGPMLTIVNYSTVKLGMMANVEHPNPKVNSRKEQLIGALVGIITGWLYWVFKKPFMHPTKNVSLAYGIQNGIDLYRSQAMLLQILEPTLVAGAAGYLFYRVLKSRRACAH